MHGCGSVCTSSIRRYRSKSRIVATHRRATPADEIVSGLPKPEAGGGLRTQVYIPCIPYVRPRVALLVGATLILSGCWTPPSATVRPEGKPRVIAQGIESDRVVDSARVESVDRAAR